MNVRALSVFNPFNFGRAFAVGLLVLVSASNVTALAQDGPKAAAAAKEAAEKMQAYLRDLEKSGGEPDYSKPPASEYFKAVFNTEAFAALSAPKTEDLSWLPKWSDSVSHTYLAILTFGAKNLTLQNQVEIPDITEMARAENRNLEKYGDQISLAMAFQLRVDARLAISATLLVDSTPPEKRALVEEKFKYLVQDLIYRVVMGASHDLGKGLKPENLRLISVAMRDTVPVWAPLATPKERAEILSLLETARVKNKNTGIDGDLDAIAAALKNVKE